MEICTHCRAIGRHLQLASRVKDQILVTNLLVILSGRQDRVLLGRTAYASRTFPMRLTDDLSTLLVFLRLWRTLPKQEGMLL